MAGVFGSLVGASASIGTTWLTKRTELVRTTAERKLRERESLYNQFLTEASRVAVHALTHSFDGPDQIVSLYGILSRIRLVAGSAVVREGEKCCVRILTMYGKPSMTADELRDLVESGAMTEAAADAAAARFSERCILVARTARRLRGRD